MDSLLIETKFISSAEASKISGYAPDYVARLCREGKVKGSRVGRAWLIDRESLASYMGVEQVRKEKVASILSEVRGAEYRAAQEKQSTTVTKIISADKRYETEAPLLSPFFTRAAVSAFFFVIVAGTAFAGHATLGRFFKSDLHPSLSAAATATNPGEAAALFTYETIQGLFSRAVTALASIFPTPEYPIVIAPWVSSPSVSTTTTIIASLPRTDGPAPIQNISNHYTLTVSGISSVELDTRIREHINNLNEHWNETGGRTSGSVDLTTIDGSTITNSTFSGSSVTTSGLTIGTLNGPLQANNGVVSATTSILAIYGGTGQTSYTVGDILYADSTGTLAKLPVGALGQVLKVSGGLPSWAADLTGSGGAGAWATTTDNLAVYPSTPTQVIIIGASATSTTGNILEVVGDSLFRGALTAYGTITAPAFTATTTATNTFPNLLATNATTTSLGINAETFTDLTGTGLSNIGGALTLNATGDWTGTFDGQEGTYYLNRANHTGTQLASTISDFNAAVQSFIHASTTIPKTYTTNSFSALQTFTAGATVNALTLGTLNGPLQANNGVVSATSSVGVLYGGTGLTTAPSYGQLLVGNSSGGYTLTATSSLGIVTSAVTSIGPAGQLQTGPAVTIATSSTGTDVTVTASGNSITFNFPSSSAVNRGLLTSADWTAFDNKVSSTSIDSVSEIETLTSANIIVSTEIDTTAELETLLGSVNVILATEIDTSSELDAIVTDNTGSGALVFGTAPTLSNAILSGQTTLQNASSTNFSNTGTAYFGGTATSSFSSTGALTLSTALTVANGGTGSTTLSGILKGNGTSQVGTLVIGSGLSYDGTTLSASGGSGVTSIGPAGQLQIGPSVTFATSSTGTDVTVTGSGNVITFNFPSSSAVNRGLLTSADWSSFNNRVSSSSIDSVAEIETLTSANIIVSTEIDTTAELETLLGSVNVILATEIDTSSELDAIVTDNTGSGALVFGTAPTITNAFLVNASSTNFSANTIAVGGTGTTTISSSGTLTTPNLTIGSLSGLLKAASGVVSTATAGVDFENPLTFAYPLVRSVNALSLAFGTTTANSWSAHNIFSSLFATNASTTNATTTTFGINTETFTDLTGTGLSNVGGALTLNAAGDWTGTFDGQEGTYYLARANHTGTQLASTISDFDSAVNSYIHASTTMPKTYTANTFTSSNVFSGGLTIGTLNGPLQANNGVVSATTSVGVQYGGTGQTTFTSGQLLYGNGVNALSSVGTSSLAVGSSLSSSGTLGYQIGGSNTTLSLNMGNANNWTALQSFANASSTLFSNFGTAYFGGTATSSFASNGALTLATALTVPNGGTGQTSYAVGDVLYADTTTSLARLPIGVAGQVLKVSGGVPSWGVDLTTGGGGGAGAWSTTTDSLAVYPTDTSDVIIVGNSATTTPSSIFEVFGKSYFSNFVGIATTVPATSLSVQGNGLFSGNVNLANLTATGTASVANLTVGSLSGLLKAVSGVVSTATAGTDYLAGGAGAATTTLSFSGPFSTSATPVVFGSSPITATYYGLATTTTLSGSNLLVSNGGAGVYSVATSSATLGTGLSGTLTTIGAGQSLSLATSSLYSGTTGQVAYFDGTNSLIGTSTLSIGTNGNVGIGTSSPIGLLTVTAGSAGRYMNISTSGGRMVLKYNDNSNNSPLLTLENTEDTGTFGVNFDFNLGYGGQSSAVGTAVRGARIFVNEEAQWTSTASTQDAFMAFYTALNGNTAEKMRIDSNGNVGIGTTSPFTALSVAGNGFFNGNLTGANLTATGTLSVTGQTTLATSLSGLLKATAGVVSTATAGVDYLAGGAGAATTTLSFSGPFSTNATPVVFGSSPITMTYYGLATTTTLGSSNLLVSNGGAGVYSVATSSATLGLGLSGSITGLGASNSLSVATSSFFTGTTGQVAYFSGTNAMVGTSTLFITPSGAIGVGTSSPSEFVANLASGFSVAATGSNDAALYLDADPTNSSSIGSSPYIRFSQDAVTARGYIGLATKGSIGLFGGRLVSDVIEDALVLEGGSAGVQFGASGNMKMTMLSGGNLGLGTTSPFAKLSLAAVSGDTNTTLFQISSSTAAFATSTLFSIGNTGTITTALSTGLVKSTSGTLSLATAGTDYLAGGAGAATTTLSFSGPFSTNATPVVFGSSPITATYYGLATTTTLSGSNLLVSNGGAGVYSVATSSATLGTGLSGTLTTIGAGQSLSLATSSLYSGTTGQVAYFSGANSLIGTSSLFIATSGNVGVGAASPSARLQVESLSEQLRLGYNSSTYLSTTIDSAGDVTYTTTGGGNYKFYQPASGEPRMQFINDDTGTTINDGFHVGLNDDETTFIRNKENTSLFFYTNNLQRLTVLGSGEVGIGTTSPYAKLSVVGEVVGANFTATTTATSTFPTLAATRFGFGSDYFTDLTGTGLTNVGGALTLNAAGDWTGTFDGQEGTYYLARANHTGTQLASTISDFDSAVNAYIHASTTIPKTYTANTFTASNVFSGGLTIGTLNGLLKATAGVVSTATAGVDYLAGGAGAATTTLSFSGPFSTNATPVVFGSSPITATYYGLATTTTLSGSNLLVSNGGAGVYSVATSSATLGTGLSGTLTTIGAGQSLSLATSSLYSGTTGQVAYFSGTNSLIGTSSLFIATSGNVGLGSTSPFARLSIHAGATDAYSANLFVVASSTSAFATSTHFVVKADGNVGIGTTSPLAPLTVVTTTSQVPQTNPIAVFQRAANIGVKIAADGLISSDTSDAIFAPFGGVNNGVALRYITGAGVETTGIALNSSGNVGIGSTSPWGLLSINPSALGSGVPEFVIGSSSATRFIVNGAGNVGIATTSPSAPLAVTGNGFFSGSTLAVGDAATGGVLVGFNNRGATTTSSIGLGTYNAVYTAFSQAIGYLNIVRGQVGTAIGSANTVNSTGGVAIGVGNTVTATSAYAIGGSITNAVTGSLMLGPTDGSKLTILPAGTFGIGTTSPFALLSVIATSTTGVNSPATLFVIASTTAGTATSTHFVVKNDGNVGVGTSSPGSLLSVGGNTYINGNLNLAAGGNLTWGGATTGYITSTGGSLDVVTSGGNYNFGSGAFRSGGSSNGFLIANGSANSATTPVFVPNRADTTTGFASGATGAINAIVGGTELARFTATGLGIGTSTPYAKLAVVGQIVGEYFTATSTSATSLFGGNVNIDGTTRLATSLTGVLKATTGTVSAGAVDLTSEVTGTLPLGNGGTGAAAFTAGSVVFSTGAALTQDNSFFYYNSASHFLGLGTTSPASRLAVSGGATIGSAYNLAAPSNGLLVQGYTGIGTTTPFSALSVSTTTASSAATPLFAVASSTNATLFNVLGGGNVGIGITSPSSKLHIYGSGAQYATIQSEDSDAVLELISGSGSVPSVNFNYVNELRANIYYANAFGPTATRSLVINDLNGDGDQGNTIINPNGGLVGLGGATSSPWGLFSINPDALDSGVPEFVIGSSSATHFLVDGAGRIGVGTTTPGTLLSLGSTGANTVNISTTATSTFGSGINIRTGCFAVNGVCVGGSSGSNYFTNSGASTYLSTGSNLAVGSTSPFARLSIHAADGTTNTTLFAIGSSTASATTTLLSVNNNGQLLLSDGSNTLPALSFGAEQGLGIYRSGTNRIAIGRSSAGLLDIMTSGSLPGVRQSSNAVLGWAVSTAMSSFDVGISRLGSGALALGNYSVAGNIDGTLATGNLGLGTSTPFAQLSIIATSTNGVNAPRTLFAIASSTAGAATSTIFGVSNTGNTGIGTAPSDVNLVTTGAFSTTGSVGMGLSVGAVSGSGVVRTGLLTGSVTGGSFSNRGIEIGSITNISGAGAVSLLTSGISGGGGAAANIGISVGSLTSTGASNTGININAITGAATANVGLNVGAVSGGTTNYSAIFNGAGAVGVGSTTPYAKLSIHANNTETNLNLLAVGSSTAAATTTHFVVRNDGNVGVGTSSPTQAFAVGGNVIIGASAGGGTNGTLTYGGVTAANTVTGTGSLVLSASPTFTGLARFSLASTSLLSVTGTAYFGGTSTTTISSTGAVSIPSAGSLTVAGNTTLANGTSTNFFAGTLSAGTATFGVTASSTFTSTGRLGMGSTSPWAQLSVNPDALGSGVPALAIGSTTGTSLVVTGAGYVGIGTSTPASELAVKGAGQISGTLFVGGAITATSSLTLTESARTSGVTPFLTITGGADTGLTAATEAPDVRFNLARTKTHANGAITLQRDFVINAATHSFSTYANGTNVITNLATLGITGAPITPTAGNGTTTNAHTLYLGASTLTASTTNSYGLTVNANTGATNNFAAQFMGGNVGIGSSSPYADLSIHANNTETAFTLFAIGSSTASATTTHFTVVNNGNVGVGSSSPWGQLSVNPNAIGSGVPEFVIGSSTATRLMITGAGRIGIATTSPSLNHTFSVTGTGYFSGGMSLGTALTVANGGTGQTTFTSGNLLYGNGTNALSSVATTSLAVGASITSSGTLGAQVGGSATTLSLNMANANIWTALQRFALASSTLFSNTSTAYFGASATTTISSTGAITTPTTLTVSGGGLTVTGNSTITGTLGSLTGLTSSGSITFSGLSTNGFVTTSGGTGALSVTVPGTGVSTFITTPSSANLAAALTDETGSAGGGVSVFSINPTFAGLTVGTSDVILSGSASNIRLGSNWLSGDGGDEGIFVDSSGNVGIGSSTPAAALGVVGGIYTTGNLIVGNGTGKLTVGTVDPVYSINGVNYSTFGAGMIGVKEEVTGTANITTHMTAEDGTQGYVSVLDFDEEEAGSDLWLFAQASHLRKNIGELSVLLTAEDNVKVWYTVDRANRKVYLLSSAPTKVSYRLTAPRFDSESWDNYNHDNITGFQPPSDDQLTYFTGEADFSFGTTTSLLDTLAINLSALASTSATTTDSEEFVEGFFSNLFARVTDWLGDAGNNLASVIAGTIRAKDELCIGNTCVTEAELQALLQNANQNGGSGGNDNGGDTGGEETPPEGDTGDDEGDTGGDTGGEETPPEGDTGDDEGDTGGDTGGEETPPEGDTGGETEGGGEGDTGDTGGETGGDSGGDTGGGEGGDSGSATGDGGEGAPSGG